MTSSSLLRFTTLLLLALAPLGCGPNELVSSSGDEPLAPSESPLGGARPKSGVMFQAFYWDVPQGGTWYDRVREQVPRLSNMRGGYGVDTVWLPPPSKGAAGPFSMGYDPYDHFDLGQLDQKGSTETRFGSQTELKALIAQLHERGIWAMADIVLNHRSGGDGEFNPKTRGNTWTDFSKVKSGRNGWHWPEFHPNDVEAFDPGAFGGFPDIAYRDAKPYGDMAEWMRWLRDGANAGFDAWRFDYVKGIEPWVPKDMKAQTGSPFSVGEFWDSNTNTLAWWTSAANMSAFDFAAYYTLKDIVLNGGGGGHLPNLIDPARSFAARDPMHAVTFAANHDTDELSRDKMLAYAFILTYQGVPTIFWKDYFDFGLSNLGGQSGNGIDALVWVRGRLGGGAPNIELLKTDDGDLLIYGSRGWSAQTPGYVVVLNDSPTAWRGAWVNTGNAFLRGKNVEAYAWHSTVAGQNVKPEPKTVRGDGWVELWAPPRGYAVYSVAGISP